MSTSCDHNYWLTVTLAVAVWPPYDALIEVLPMETALRNPVELTVATVGTLDDQPAWLVTVLNEPSEKFAWFSLEPFREFPFCQILRTPVLS